LVNFTSKKKIEIIHFYISLELTIFSQISLPDGSVFDLLVRYDLKTGR